MIKCSNCEELQNEDSKFCIKCGNKLIAKPNSNIVKKTLWIAIPLILLIGVGLAVYYNYSKVAKNYTYGVVIANKLNVRSTKNKDATNNISGILDYGYRIPFYQTDNEWGTFEYQGQESFVKLTQVWPVYKFRLFEQMISSCPEDSLMYLDAKYKNAIFGCDKTIGNVMFEKDTTRIGKTDLMIYKKNKNENSFIKGNFLNSISNIQSACILFSSNSSKDKYIYFIQANEQGEISDFSQSFKGDYSSIFKIEKGEYVIVNGQEIILDSDAIGVKMNNENQSTKIIIKDPNFNWEKDPYADELILADLTFLEGC